MIIIYFLWGYRGRERDIRINLFLVLKYDIVRNFCLSSCSVYVFFDFFVEVDWDIYSLVILGNLFSNFLC